MLWVHRQFSVQRAASCKQCYACYLQDSMIPVVLLFFYWEALALIHAGKPNKLHAKPARMALNSISNGDRWVEVPHCLYTGWFIYVWSGFIAAYWQSGMSWSRHWCFSLCLLRTSYYALEPWLLITWAIPWTSNFLLLQRMELMI